MNLINNNTSKSPLQLKFDIFLFSTSRHNSQTKVPGIVRVGAARTLKLFDVRSIRPKDLFQMLQANKWIFKRHGSGTFTAYQDKIQQGLLEHKVTVVTRSDGSEKTTEQVRVTPKGIAKLAEMLSVDIAS